MSRRMKGGNVRKIRVFYLVLLSIGLGLVWLFKPQQPVEAEPNAKYVGTETCATCHVETAKNMALSVHRRTLFNKDPSQQGCEACHGPGGEHVAAGGDKTKIMSLGKLSASQRADLCLKCHTQSGTTLWHTSMHARSKLSCSVCHDPHSAGDKSLLQDMEDAKLDIEGLTRAIKEADQEANAAAAGSAEKEEALQRLAKLTAEKEKLVGELKGQETIYKRTAEPYVCFNCHKAQQIQSRMPSHHPVAEGKVRCSDCHNPHGGPGNMLKEETVGETCNRCHADKIGPFAFEHPPVAEDCTTCHNSHGSVKNNLLVQSQPFLCLKCHVGPHSRSSTLGSPVDTAKYYTECTDCHSQIHGSDSRPSFRY